MNVLSRETSNLTRRYHELKKEQPNLRARQAAAKLEASEAELVASGALGTAIPLRPEWAPILTGLSEVGQVMALTRNETAVIEVDGPYSPVTIQGPHAVVYGGPVDLRIFLTRLRWAFACERPHRGRVLRSLQFFDTHGEAVHKVYLRDTGDVEAWKALVERFTASTQAVVPRVASPAPSRADEDALDQAAFHAGWLALKDTHDFFGLLLDHGLTRLQALELAPPSWAEALQGDCLQELLVAVAAREVPVMLFVASPGVVQIHTGRLHRIVPLDGWVNVLDSGHNLHVRADRITSAWMVRKPTRDGPVTSVEFFDAEEQLVLQIFGERHEGQVERDDWRSVVHDLPRP